MLRHVYNTVPIAREVVDRLVYAIAGRDGRISMSGGAERMREFLEARMDAPQVQKYFQHALRDAFVFGDGYIAFSQQEPLGPYCVRAHDVAIGEHAVGKPAAAGARTKHLGDPVTHLRGIEQVDSPFGLSLLEPMALPVNSLRLAEQLDEALAMAADLGGVTDEELRSAKDRTERIRSGLIDRANELYAPALRWTSKDLSDLYFQGASDL